MLSAIHNIISSTINHGISSARDNNNNNNNINFTSDDKDVKLILLLDANNEGTTSISNTNIQHSQLYADELNNDTYGANK